MAGLGSIMSPLETINKVKDEKRSLDSLARFPYPVLMGMVKNKEIKPEEISIVMGRKAEIIQEEENYIKFKTKNSIYELFINKKVIK